MLFHSAGAVVVGVVDDALKYIIVKAVQTVSKFSFSVFSTPLCYWAIFCLLSVKAPSVMTKYLPMRLVRLRQIL